MRAADESKNDFFIMWIKGYKRNFKKFLLLNKHNPLIFRLLAGYFENSLGCFTHDIKVKKLGATKQKENRGMIYFESAN
jgi:hypothetical protein